MASPTKTHLSAESVVVPNATVVPDWRVLTTLYSTAASAPPIPFPFTWVATRANPAPAVSVGKLASELVVNPVNPRTKSFVAVVETPPTLGVDATVPVATAGTDTFGSHGVPVLAPETPNTTIDASSVAPESVTVIAVEVSGEAATA